MCLIMGKIAIGFGAILLVSSVTSLVSVLADRQVRDKASVVVEQTLPTLSCIIELIVRFVLSNWRRFPSMVRSGRYRDSTQR